MADDNSADSSTDALVRWAATCVETFLESFAGMLQPSTSLEQRLERFVARSSAPGSTRRVVLITSGGTTVPLERNCVRSIDNFSSGTRGAWSCEEFLEKHEEYDVLFLTRGGSAQPFVSDFQEVLFSDDDRGDPTYLHACVEKVMAHCHGPRFLRVEFTTVFEYLHLVRLMSKHLKPLGSRVMVYLAAAVSDFYVPETRLPTNKIQSRPEDKFQIELEKTPKALGVVRHIWLPEAYVVSFKLETDETILIDKARAAVAAYNVDCVVANLLQTRKELVQLVRGVDEAPMLLRRDACVAGSRLETKLVATLVEFHSRSTTGSRSAYQLSLPRMPCTYI